MKKAMNKGNGQTYTVAEYIQQFGPKHDARMQLRVRPQMHCYACAHDAHTVAENFPERGHWAHDGSAARPWCPLSQPAARRYELLPNVAEDIARGAALRASFMRRWQQHWGMILAIAKVGEIHQFIEFVHKADRDRFWHRNGLSEWLIPYIFLATADHAPPKSAKGAALRPEWLRFWFDSRIAHLDDLWIRFNGDFRFMSAIYENPARGAEPNASHLIDFSPISVDPNWLDKTFRTPNAYQLGAMRAAFGDAA